MGSLNNDDHECQPSLSCLRKDEFFSVSRVTARDIYEMYVMRLAFEVIVLKSS